MRIQLICVVLLLAHFSKAQNFENDSIWYAQKRMTLEVMAAPFYIINTAGIGVARYANSNEHLIDVNAIYYPIGQEEFSLGLHYSYHRYITTVSSDFHPYISFWGGIRRKNLDNTYENGIYYNECDLRLGGGFGGSYSFRKGGMMRFDLGVGAAYHMDDYQSELRSSVFPFTMNFSQFSTSTDSAILPAFKLRVRYQFNLSR